MTAWLLVFLVQSLLVPARKLRVHMRLGWSSLSVALVASTSGVMLAVQSVRPVPDIPFWGMTYRQFLLVMLTEVALFTCFVAAGVLTRKRPKVHRAMMVLASLSILAAATVRMPALTRVFGDGGWPGIFGPTFALGALLVVVSSALVGAADRWLVTGYALLVVVYMTACALAVSQPWDVWAHALLGGDGRARSGRDRRPWRCDYPGCIAHTVCRCVAHMLRSMTRSADKFEESLEHCGKFLVSEPPEAPPDPLGGQCSNLAGLHPRALW